MWIVKRIIGGIQLVVNGIVLLGLYTTYVNRVPAAPGAPVMNNTMNAILIGFVALNLISGTLLVCTPRPEPQPQHEERVI